MAELLARVGYQFSGVKKGEIVEGVISSITGREVLIDLGGKTEGVVGRKEWEQVKDFVATLKVGDKISATVISPENDKGQMILSIKKSSLANRWDKANKLFESGEATKVKGLEVNRGGLLVEADGAHGFIPTSQLSPAHQSEINKLIGKSLTAKVIEVDQKQNRLIFSERALTEQAEKDNKLALIKSRVKIGEKYAGTVSAIMSYGIFVNLENGADGLVHISEVSWEKVNDLSTIFKVGDKVEVVVVGINESDAKLNLSIKQLQPDPWLSLSEKYTKDQIIKGTVAQKAPYGIFINLEDGIDGLIRSGKIPPGKSYDTGDKIECTIESIDLPNHRISLVPVLKEKPIGYK